MEPEQDFATKLRDWCGLFILIQNEKVTFVHQTAREFLLREAIPGPQQTIPVNRWGGSFSAELSHRVMADICTTYLLLDSTVPQYEDNFATHSAFNWDWHFDKGYMAYDEVTFGRIVAVCDPSSEKGRKWMKRQSIGQIMCEFGSDYSGLTAVLVVSTSLDTKKLLNWLLSDRFGAGLRLDSAFDSAFACALWCTTVSGSIGNMQLLLSYAENHNLISNTIKVLAVSSMLCNNLFSGQWPSVKMLLQYGFKPDDKGYGKYIPLCDAVKASNPEGVKATSGSRCKCKLMYERI